MSDLYRNTLTYIFYCKPLQYAINQPQSQLLSTYIAIDTQLILSKDLQSFKHTINVQRNNDDQVQKSCEI